MLRDIRLRFWPSYYDCLRWSPSGIVAVMASEYVHILVPAKEDSKKIRGTPQFEITKADLRALSDETDNIVVNEPANIYSIGEEQGPGYVKAIEWSPVGVSRNRGCILAVLTTTHQLRIFEADGHASKAWRVRADVSRVIAECGMWEERAPEVDGGGDGDGGVRGGLPVQMVRKLRGRTRGIAWSFGCPFEERKWGESILAVTNDYREIVFLHVRPNSCKVIHIFTPDRRPGPGFYPKMTWSPWKSISKDTGESYLTLVNAGKVLLYRVRMTAVSGGDDVKLATEEEPFVVGRAVTEVHPILALIWYKEEVEGYRILVYAVQRYLRIVAIHSSAEEFVVGETAHVWEFENGYIDPVSGLTITPSASSKSCIDIHLSTVLGKTQIVTWDLTNLRNSESNSTTTTTSITKNALSTASADGIDKEKFNVNAWEYVIQDRKQDFIAEWDLNSATCKIWGVAGSPLGSIVAAVISNEPDDSLQYITHSKETSRLVFGVQLEGEEFVKRVYGGDVLGPVTTNCSENFILECANLHDPEVQEEEGMEVEIRHERQKSTFEILTATLKERASRDAVCNVRILQTSSTPSLTTSLSRNIYRPSTLTATRYLTCLRLFPQSRREDGTPIIPLHTPEPAIIASIVANILQAGRAINHTDEISVLVMYNATIVGLVGLWRFEDGALVGELLQGVNWLRRQEVFKSGSGAKGAGDLKVELEFIKKRVVESGGGGGGRGGAKSAGRGGSVGGGGNTGGSPSRGRRRSSASNRDRGTSSHHNHHDQPPASPTLSEREKELLGEHGGIVGDKLTRCGVCGEGFRWDDVDIAECGGGHRFPRCAITAIPIQAGSTWKTCSICERVVLDKYKIPVFPPPPPPPPPAPAAPPILREQDEDGDHNMDMDIDVVQKEKEKEKEPEKEVLQEEQQQQVVSLLDVVLKAWDICVHCGGRFR